jgi:hypothetical protein
MNHVINVLLNMSHRLTDTPRPLNPPIAQRHLEAEVAHCVGGVMALRWCAADRVEAGKQFRRVNGHLHRPALRAALQRHAAEQTVGADRHDETVNVA